MSEIDQIKEVTHRFQPREGWRAFLIDADTGPEFGEWLRGNLKAIVSGDLTIEPGDFEHDGERYTKNYFKMAVAKGVVLCKEIKPFTCPKCGHTRDWLLGECREPTGKRPPEGRRFCGCFCSLALDEIRH